MMPRKYDRILADCLDRMDRGETLSQILAVYPGLESKLEPLVLAAMLGRALPPPVPSYTALRLGKNDLLAEMAMMESEGAFLDPATPQPEQKPISDRLQPAYRFAMVGAVVILAGGFFTLSASASDITDQVIRSIFLGFDQVGEMFWARPDQENNLGDGSIFNGSPGFPDQPVGVARGYRLSQLENNGNDPIGLSGSEQQGDLVSVPTPFDFEDEDLDLDLDQDLDDELDKDQEDDLKDEEKDLKEEEKEEDKDDKEEEKEDKEDDKEAEKDDKEEEKEDKEDDKEAEKDDKEEEKEDKEDEKEAEKLDKIKDKDDKKDK